MQKLRNVCTIVRVTKFKTTRTNKDKLKNRTRLCQCWVVIKLRVAIKLKVTRYFCGNKLQFQICNKIT